MSDKGIWIITTEENTNTSEDTGSKAGYDTGANYGQPQTTRRGKFVRSEDLKRNMAEFIDIIEDIFEQAQKPLTQMQLDEIELQIEVNGEGQVSLFGIGGTVGGKSAITLKFKRQE